MVDYLQKLRNANINDLDTEVAASVDGYLEASLSKKDLKKALTKKRNEYKFILRKIERLAKIANSLPNKYAVKREVVDSPPASMD